MAMTDESISSIDLGRRPIARCDPIERDYAMHPDSGDPNLLIYGIGKKVYANRLSPGCTMSEIFVCFIF